MLGESSKKHTIQYLMEKTENLPTAVGSSVVVYLFTKLHPTNQRISHVFRILE